MKVNVIIKIQATDDSDQYLEANIKECDTETLLSKESMAALHPIIKSYVQTFDGEVA
jgi:hypothetical protein